MPEFGHTTNHKILCDGKIPLVPVTCQCLVDKLIEKRIVGVNVVNGNQQQRFGVAIDTTCQISSPAAEQQSGLMQTGRVRL